ncbi:MAG: Holliday junction branch migration protein RuvA [Deltaproteobacteria bacterium]|nr:Holliday junction branch migration protein RuvA [Deltaproteobacteria bacterium]MCB9489475.1 Holliday junction branch migration protein RuvA [Deltaproteobacteria bacterium]
MIAWLQGRVIEKDAGRLVMDVGGVGYEVLVPSTVLTRVVEERPDTELFIRTVVREDAFLLFGFDRRHDRDLFDMLVTVKSVGPKMALAVLSGLPFRPLITAIHTEDLAALTKISGLGKRTAERIVVELKDKVKGLALEAIGDIETAPEAESPVAADALSALQNLGYSRVEAERAVSEVAKTIDPAAPVVDFLEKCLKLLAHD